MRGCLALSVLFLAACDTAGPGFRGIDPVVRSIDGSRFSIRRNGDMAEVIRTSPEILPLFPVVARKAGRVTQSETGCVAAWVQGDPSMMLVGLSCDGRRAPKPPKRRGALICDVYDARVSPLGGGSAVAECVRD